MLSRRQSQLTIACITLLLYVYLVAIYVARGQVSWATVPVILVAMYLADAASGVAHLIVDYTPNVRGIGLKELFEYEGSKGSDDYVARRKVAMRKLSGFHEVVFDFKVHHLTPDALGRRSALKMTLPVIVFAAFPLTLALTALGELSLIAPNISMFLAVVVGCATVSQYAHSCTHKERTPWVARGLQVCGLFLSPHRHQIHHDDPQRNFCLLNGWANPLVNWLFRLALSQGYVSKDNLDVV